MCVMIIAGSLVNSSCGEHVSNDFAGLMKEVLYKDLSLSLSPLLPISPSLFVFPYQCRQWMDF